jgi:hypothetical protein
MAELLMSLMRLAGLAALCAGVLTSACAADTSDSGAEAAHTGPLCPGCVTLAGGETGDFPGGGIGLADPCPAVRHVASDAALVLPSGLSAQAAIALVQREVQLPATWRETVESSFFDGYPRKHSGFSAQTDLTLQIQVTGVERLDPVALGEDPPYAHLGYEDVPFPEVQAACDGIALTADVSLIAGDGSIAGTFERAAIHVHSETEASLNVSGDISQFTGSLQVGAREGERLQGSLSVYFNAERVRGVLAPIVKPAKDSYGYLENSDGGPTTPEYRPLELRWPGTDRCDAHSFLYTGEDARARTEQTVALLSYKSTYTGAYFEPRSEVVLDPTVLGETQMSLEVASPSSLCEGSYGRSPFREQDIELPAHFVSSDGRYDLSVPLDVAARVTPAGSRGALIGFESGALPVDEFQTRFGIGPLDFGGAPCASLGIAYEVYSNTVYSRLLQVEAGRCGSGSKLEGAHVVEMLGMTPM